MHAYRRKRSSNLRASLASRCGGTEINLSVTLETVPCKGGGMLNSRQHQSDLDSPPPKSCVRATPISHYHELTPPDDGGLGDADVEKAREIAGADPRVARLLERGKHVAIGGMRLTGEG